MSAQRIVIVGASLAGVQAAQAIRRNGFEGELMMVGEEPSRPYDRPPLSKQFLTDPDYDENKLTLRPVVSEDLELEWRLGTRAVGLNLEQHEISLDGGGSVSYDGLVVATGAIARDLPAAVGHAELGGVHLLRTLDHARALKADLLTALSGGGTPRVVVCGAGFIGAEVAASCRQLGAEVTMVDAAPTPMARVLDPDSGAAIAELHRSHGVELRLETGISSVTSTNVDRQPWIESVQLDNGDQIQTDLLVIGIGVVPATQWLNDSGLTIDDGIIADNTCLAAPRVVVAGDVARWPNAAFGDQMMRIEQWDNAIDQGGYAGARLLAAMAGQDDPEPFAPIPWFWTDQFDRKIQLAGISRGEPVLIAGDRSVHRFVQAYMADDGAVAGVLCWNHPRQAVIGRQLVAAGADLATVRERLS